MLSKRKGGAVSDKSIVEGGTLFSPRYLKLERPSQLEMFSRVICLALGNKAEEIKKSQMLFLSSAGQFSVPQSGIYFVGILQMKDRKARDQSHSCSGLDMTKPDSASSNRFSVLS